MIPVDPGAKENTFAWNTEPYLNLIQRNIHKSEELCNCKKYTVFLINPVSIATAKVSETESL